MTNAYGILFIHFWDSSYSCQDDDHSHVTQDILRIDAHFTADILHLSITLMKCCGHDTWRCLCKWKWDWYHWHGPGSPITIYWFLLLNRLSGRQLSKQIADDGLWVRSLHVYLYLYGGLEMLQVILVSDWLRSHRRKTIVHRQLSRNCYQRESSARMMEMVYSHQFYLTAKKAYPSVLESSLQLDLYIFSLFPLF